MDPLLIMIILVVFFLGMAIVAIFLLVKDAKKNTPQSEELEIQRLAPSIAPARPPAASAPAAAAPAAPVPSPFASAPQSPPGLLRIHRSPMGEWEIYINGTRYYALEAVPDDAVRQLVVEATKALVSFERSYIQRQRGDVAPAAPAPASVATVTPPAPTIAPPPRYIPTPPPVTPTRRGIGPMLTIDLAKEISDVLEEMQPRVPALANRLIQLKNAATGGLYFVVDNIPYNAIEDIPDLAVQQLIRAATREWERR